MSDLTRAEAIAELTEHLNHWERLLKEGICGKEQGERTIKSLEFAIDSLKVDETYNLMYEKVDFIELPEGATNGEIFEKFMRKAYPRVITIYQKNEADKTIKLIFSEDWWNSPYRKEQE